jgi:methylglutaconyl-CoA hydratase
MTQSTIKIHVDARGVASLTLSRPERHNALNAQMIAELTAAAYQLGTDQNVRVVLLKAEGESFCAGGDLDWMKEQFTATRDQRIVEARALAYMLKALNTMPKPLIGIVHGPAYGGGVGMISVCDNAIASKQAQFALTETKLGLIPATIGPYVAAKLGEGAARRVFMSGRVFSADEALQLGLVGSVVESSALDDAAGAEERAYLSAAPGAVASAKQLLSRLTNTIDDRVIEDTISKLADTWEGTEAQDGISAFLGKRIPGWVTKA